MAEFTDRIKLVFDAVTQDAAGSVGKLRSGVSEAEGGFGKLKAAAGGAMDMITSSPAAMAAAGVAIGKVALDLATGFEQAALSAENFATASGLSVEDASRWQEVAGDLGVSTETLEGAVNKLNIAASKGTLEKLGIGGADTNEKLLNALEHLNGITDATERAKQGAALFGKSWASLAPLVAESGSLKDNLAAVSDAKVIDEGEVAKAREMRDAMDKLSDTLDDVKLSLGEALIGPITNVAEILGNVTDMAGKLKDVTGGVGDVMRMLPGAGIPDMLEGLSRATDFSAGWQEQLKGVGETLTSNLPVVGGWASGLFGAGDASDSAAEAEKRRAAATNVALQASKDAAAAAKDQEDALVSLSNAVLGSFNSTLQFANASDKTSESLDAYAKAATTAEASSWGNKDANEAAAKAQREGESAALAQAAAAAQMAKDNATATGAAWDQEAANTAMANSLRATAGTLSADSPLRRSLLAYANQIEHIPATANTEFTADTETASQKVKALSDQIFALVGRIFHVQVQASTPTPGSVVPGASVTALGAAPNAVSALPGVTAPRAISQSPTALGGGGPVINLSVNVAPFTNGAEVGRQIADYLDAFYRRSGQRRPVAA